MPIVTSHHVVPDPFGSQSGVSVEPGGSGGPATPPPGGDTTIIVHSGGLHPGYAPLILFLLALLLAALAAIMLSARSPPRARIVADSIPARSVQYHYRYTGARAALRGIFLRVRSRFEPVLGSRIYSATARELAEVEPGLSAFANEYSRAMYSRVEPGEADVERIAILAGERD